MKKVKKIILYVTLLTMLIAVTPLQTKAAVKISSTSLTLTEGQSKTLKITGTKKTVKWSSSNKKVATVSSKGKVQAKKKGLAIITAKVSSKKFKCRVRVNEKITIDKNAPGGRQNPLSAYDEFKTDVYDYDEKIGRFSIKLLDYKDGDDALEFIFKDDEDDDMNTFPSASQEYIYLKFQIKYISGEKSVEASDVINYYSGLFNSSANYQLENIDWAYGYEDEDSTIDDMSEVTLYPGGSAICSKAILVRSGNTPVTYRIPTGYDKKEYEQIYTWFTTKK